jgi:hypothetical protein
MTQLSEGAAAVDTRAVDTRALDPRVLKGHDPSLRGAASTSFPKLVPGSPHPAAL